ncbi:uncharacterized protein BJ171DRAFT_484818 [Polychytrium aggregatum]|uniref:uncharacterized protein n=1 Tax=Polychytrium aggregatum TaxID=110093 RepID=UPI0022FF0D0D|nr:uncharacterized protein BJ171DRAFT_484818 [Polychytrium aggregatum]KAI9209706.1 hypothetical protein BJ171DRAFT_484818 [Polychytrium aggregatum]
MGHPLKTKNLESPRRLSSFRKESLTPRASKRTAAPPVPSSLKENPLSWTDLEPLNGLDDDLASGFAEDSSLLTPKASAHRATAHPEPGSAGRDQQEPSRAEHAVALKVEQAFVTAEITQWNVGGGHETAYFEYDGVSSTEVAVSSSGADSAESAGTLSAAEPSDSAGSPSTESDALANSNSNANWEREAPTSAVVDVDQADSHPGSLDSAKTPADEVYEIRRSSGSWSVENKSATFQLSQKPRRNTTFSAAGSKAQDARKKVKTGGVQKKSLKKRPTDLTIPKPFSFATNLEKFGNNVSTATAHSPYKSLAARIKEYEAKTPERFRVKPTAAPKFKQLAMTIPQSPFLRTKVRNKPVTVFTSEQLELAELEKHQPFKARPADPKVLKGGPQGVPKAPRFEITVPQSPAITKPKPLPDAPPSPPRIIKANPIRHFPNVEVKHESRKIVPSDFELPGEKISERKVMQFLREARKKMQDLEKSRNFKAQPLRIVSPKGFCPPAVPKITEPEPFQLETDLRHDIHSKRLEEKTRRQIEDEERQRQFQAQPLPDGDAFIPKRSNKPLTISENVTLHSEIRAVDRHVFDEQIEAKIREDELAKELKKLQEEAKIAEEVKQARRKMVHVAQPIHHYSSIAIQPSSRKLTEPQSPMIGEKRKLKQQLGKSSLRRAS